jgi:hypothetical protein
MGKTSKKRSRNSKKTGLTPPTKVATFCPEIIVTFLGGCGGSTGEADKAM